MHATDGIWVPSYYRHRHPIFSWVRDAGRPQVVDWIAGATCAVLVLGLVALVRAPNHQAPPSASVATTTVAQGADTNADRVAYLSRPLAVDK